MFVTNLSCSNVPALDRIDEIFRLHSGRHEKYIFSIVIPNCGEQQHQRDRNEEKPERKEKKSKERMKTRTRSRSGTKKNEEKEGINRNCEGARALKTFKSNYSW